MKRIIYIIFCISGISCGQHNAELENALKLAGENRGELEKVLYHYSQNPSDSLKLQAATFLIKNMPGHYTLEGSLINTYRKKIDTDTTVSYFAKKTLDISLSHMDQFHHTANKKEDVQNIKADFLIRHIDRSFENLNSYSWLEDIPFDLFLKYILPYRFANERPDLWIDSLHLSPKALQELLFSDDVKYTITKMEYALKFSEATTFFQSHFIQELLRQDIYRDCQHITTQRNFKSRASCLPVAIDFIPHYITRIVTVIITGIKSYPRNQRIQKSAEPSNAKQLKYIEKHILVIHPSGPRPRNIFPNFSKIRFSWMLVTSTSKRPMSPSMFPSI